MLFSVVSVRSAVNLYSPAREEFRNEPYGGRKGVPALGVEDFETRRTRKELAKQGALGKNRPGASLAEQGDFVTLRTRRKRLPAKPAKREFGKAPRKPVKSMKSQQLNEGLRGFRWPT